MRQYTVSDLDYMGFYYRADQADEKFEADRKTIQQLRKENCKLKATNIVLTGTIERQRERIRSLGVGLANLDEKNRDLIRQIESNQNKAGSNNILRWLKKAVQI